MTAGAAFDVFRLHGGRVAAARALFPHTRAPWVDLSTGISPWAYPHEPLPREAFTRLPDAEALAALEAAAASSFGVADAQSVVATPGSDLALRVLGRVLAGRRVAVVRPGYSGHVLAWGDAPVTTIAACDIESAASDHDVIVLANPNNPDGRVVPHERLLGIAARLAERAGVLLVDEAFADAMPEASLCGFLDRIANVVVLRSFGKFFGLAGVRLGFVVTSTSTRVSAQRVDSLSTSGRAASTASACADTLAAPGAGASVAASIAAEIRRALGDWPVSGPAVAIGTAAYRDTRWQSEQRHRLAHAARRLDALLTEAGLAIEGGTVLYRLARCADADAVFERLAARGILTRPFAGDSTLLRIGLPGDESQWARLAAALDTRCTS